MNSRTLTENHPDRGLVTNTYDKSSNLISMNRASIGAISFRYSYNRLLSRTMPGSSGNDLYDVVYTYGTLGDGKNGAGRIVAIDQGQGFKVDHYSYDELGQRVVEQSTIQVPQVGQRTYQTQFKYSSFGRILQASYPDGDVVNYHYTDKGELFSIESTAPGEPKLFVVQETQYNGFGQIGTLIYGNGTKTTYNYASSDFVTSGLGHLNKTALFTSTVEGKATLGGATTSLASRDYQYSNLGMVSSLNKSIHSSLAAGITSLDYSFSYDDKGRLLGSTLATGGMNIYELTMGYNAVGGITSKDSDLPNGGHPLVNPNLKYDLSYSYNPAKPHQLLSVTEVGPNGGITNFSYDDVGNLTESFGPSGTEELIWNELQQLSGVMNGNGIHHYVYDHNGERIMKSSINRSWVQVNDQNVDDIQYLEPYTLYVNPYYVVTSFHNGDHISKHYYMNTQRVATDISINYQGPPPPIAPGAPMSSDSTQSTGIGISASFEDDLNKILQQFDAGDLSSSLSENGVAMEKYYPNAASESESINRILYWYHPDYLGSVDLVTDRNGVAYEFFLYTPWGEDMYSYNSGTSSFTSPYRFNGKEKDPETGYGYYGARYYQSKFSVWMSVDPLAHETLEPYVYTRNNPILMVDSDGRKPWPVGIVKMINEHIGYNASKRSISIWLPEDVIWGKDCITIFNDIVQNVLYDENQKVGSQIIGNNSTHSKLKERGRASDILEFKFATENGNIAYDNRTADHLEKSIGQYIVDNYNKDEGGVKIYGFSVLDGYHSMMITYGPNEDGDMEFNLFDQGPATNAVTGHSSFNSAEDLDEAINDYVKAKQKKETPGGHYYPAKAELFLIKNE